MNEDYLKIVKYVNAAVDLAEAVEADIATKSRKVSNNTVLKLSKFAVASNQIQKLLDYAEGNNVKLQ